MEKELSVCDEGMVASLREVCPMAAASDGNGERSVFSHNRSLSHDSSAANCDAERTGRGRAIVEIVYLIVSLILHSKKAEGKDRAYRIKMTMPPVSILETLHPIIGMQIKQESLQLRDLAILRDMNLREPVNRLSPFYYRLQPLRRDCIGFVDNNNICV